MENQSQELVNIGQTSTEVGFSEPIETGLETSGNLKITSLILVQPTTRETQGARPGQILDVLTGEAFDSISVVPLRIFNNRVMFPPGADLDAKPICRSSDGLVPSPYADVPQAKQCGYFDQKTRRFVAVCPNAKWRKDSEGKSIKPSCAEKKRLLVYAVGIGLPRWFNIGGAGMSAWEMTRQKLLQHMLSQKNTKGITRQLYDYWFSLSSDKINGKKGAYYVPRFDLKLVETPGEYAGIYQSFAAAINQAASEDDEATQDAAVNASVSQVVEAEYVSEV